MMISGKNKGDVVIEVIFYNNESVNLLLITVSIFWTVTVARHSASLFIFTIFNSQTNTVTLLAILCTGKLSSKFSETTQEIKDVTQMQENLNLKPILLNSK